MLDDYKISKPLDPFMGCNKQYEYERGVKTTEAGPRHIYVEVTNCFMSRGAIHFYGKIRMPTILHITPPPKGVEDAGWFEWQLHRQIKETEYDFYGEVYGKEGAWVHGFKSKEDVKKRARQVVRKFFKGFRVHYHRFVFRPDDCPVCKGV